MIRVKLTHLTEYSYDRAVALSPHVVRLRPAPHTRTHIESYSLAIEPEKKFINWQQDPFANWQARLVFPEPAHSLSVRVELVAHIKALNPFDFFVEEAASTFPFRYEQALADELQPYLKISEDSNELRAFVAALKLSGMRTIDMIVAVNHHVRDHVGYVIRLEPGVQKAAETLRLKSGSCRDSAYLLVQVFRHLGLAARFVSGYLIQLTPDERADEKDGPAEDFTDLHAWAEVFIPGAGWVGLDATSGLMASEGHIPLAATPEPASAAAIQGFTEPCKAELKFSMRVERPSETARVSKPYSDEIWRQVTEFAEGLDANLAKSGMKLTIGGEPTFVSASDRESRQWNYDALGEDKYRIADQLLSRFYSLYSNGGIVLRSQGKWYPGEPLPRWSLDCFWRRDGVPLWKDPALLGLGKPAAKKFTTQDAERFIALLSKKLGLPESCILPAYEDPIHYAHAESRLPPEFNPEVAGNSYDEIERRRLLKIIDAGLGAIAGYALPLAYDAVKKHWQSAVTVFRRGFLALLPGDSPLGLRLPLTAIAETFEPLYDQDPLAREKHIGELPQPHGKVREKPIQTMLCCEVRSGELFIFLPPVNSVEEFIALLALIENSARELNLEVSLEGYEPPRDARLNFFRITPDPGVIEVNMFPSQSVKELMQKTETIYAEAERCGLTTDRYMLDGRPCATGGGNHITLGALRSEDSPFLRRADLLASLVAYWQNHPALSYVFNGLYIGPTSQAPRLDEARDDNLYEAEIALKELRLNKHPAPWLIDRIMRNVLCDMTGNTHRTEISIDKLYAPGSVTGRLGLVELRAFEMPPNSRMSIVQQLLVISLLLMFWREPYRVPLKDWGNDLRDRWLMPHFLEQDLAAIVRDLKMARITFPEAVFSPFIEFRFPLYGQYRCEGIEIELRMALHPWNVLGEETVSGNVSRAVDSAVERLQVKVRGLQTQKHIITCNGFALPLRLTEAGEHIAAVVFKAWAPPFTLHPTIPVHAPLKFGIFERGAGRYVGGCSYHVAHPGGRSFDTYPVNSLEAESRRLSRFSEQAQMPRTDPVIAINPHYPHTLDLRYA